LALETEPLGEPVRPPRLALLVEARDASPEHWPMEGGERLQVSFRVSGDRAFSLALVGGSALRVRTLELTASTFSRSEGLKSQMSESRRGVMVSSSSR
jgi:hypothetical protein